MSTSEQEELLQFMYQAPVALMQSSLLGGIKFSTPMSAQLLLPLSDTGALDNIFDVLDRTAPEIRNSVISFKKKRGRILTDHRCVAVDADGEMRAALSVTIVKLGADKLAISISDIRELVQSENEATIRGQIASAVNAAVDDCEVCVIDNDGVIAEWAGGGGPSGHGAREIVGEPLSVLIVQDGEAYRGGDLQPQEAEDTVEKLLERASNAGVATVEGLRTRNDGSYFWAETTVTRLTDTFGAAAGYTVVTRDTSKARAREEALIDLASRDPLTGVLNRRSFLNAAKLMRDDLDDRDAGFVVIVADLDRFKQLNDRYGHAVGDEALKAFVNATKVRVRDNEMIARFGGEEFVYLIPGLDLASGLKRADEMRTAVEAIRLDVDGEEALFTASFGVAAPASREETFAELIERADEALYQAKQDGRNRVAAARAPSEARRA